MSGICHYLIVGYVALILVYTLMGMIYRLGFHNIQKASNIVFYIFWIPLFILLLPIILVDVILYGNGGVAITFNRGGKKDDK